MPASLSPRAKAYLAMLGVTLCWGAAMPVVKPALEFITPLQFMWARFVLAAFIALPWLLMEISKLQKLLSKQDLYLLLATSATGAFSLLLLYEALDRTSALESSLILNTGPIIMTILGVSLLREKEEKQEILGLILSIIGSTLIIAAPFFSGQNTISTDQTIAGILILLCYLFIDGFNVLITKRHLSHIPKHLIMLISVMIGAFTLSLLVIPLNLTPSLGDLNHASVGIAIAYMTIFGTFVAFTLNFIGFNLIEASEAALFTYLRPLVYVPLAIIWLKESIDIYQIIGLVIISIGVFLAEYRPRNTNTH